MALRASRNMASLCLSFEGLLDYLSQVVSERPDPRQASKALRDRLSDVVLGAFLVFFIQCFSCNANRGVAK